MDMMPSENESDAEPMSTDMLEDISEVSQSHPIINRREARYKVRDCIEKIQAKCKGALLSMRNMGKRLHKVFRAIINDMSQALTILGEPRS